MDFQFIDWVFIVGYVVVVFGIAIKSSQEMGEGAPDRTDREIAEEKYLADRSLTFVESICSIIATEVSALTIVGVPAFAYNKDFSFLQIYLGAIAARLVIALVFLPRVYGKGLTIYEVMARDFGLPSGRRAVALFYAISKIVSIGVRLFSASILLATFIDVSVIMAVVLVTLVTLVYIQFGGLKTVARTDIFQLALFLFGGVVAHVLIPRAAGTSWGELMQVAQAAGKTTILDFTNPWPFVIGIMGGILFDMSTHGVDQDYAQRLTANRSLRSGQLAIFLSSFASVAIGLLFLGIGALLWAFYQSHPVPEGLPGADYLFPHFIVTYFPVGMKGLMVAAVLAATMSTLDSTVNALSATMYNDIFPERQKTRTEFWSVVDSVVMGLLILAIAILSSKYDGLLLLGLKAQSWTGGSLLALFVSKLVLRKYFHYRLDLVSVVGAYAVGMTGVYVNTQVLAWDWNLNVYWGFVLALIYLKLLSQLRTQE